LRIAQLDLKAFGHFTDRRIEFGATPDFHIAYGPNEAGKTTMSRALKAALFGFHTKTSDDFLHPYASLRVGLVLESADGKRLAVMRRKAIRNSLIKYDPATGEELGEAIVDDLLPRWMGGLTEGLYTSMFSLDHAELVAGGRALSEGKGEIGQSLFEAGAGLTSIRTLREQLTAEAGRLFRPQSRTLSIPLAVNAYAEAKKEGKDAQTRTGEWDTLRKAAEEARSAYEMARAQQDVLQKESRRLERLAAVLPDVAFRSLVLERIEAMGDVNRLEPGAKERRIAAETLLRQAEATLTQAKAEGALLQGELDVVPRSPTILAEGAAIEAAYYSLVAYREARDAAVAADSKIQLASKQAAELANAIGETLRDDLRDVIPTTTQRARVQGLDNEGGTLKTELRQALKTLENTKVELQELADELAGLGAQIVPPSLQAALRAFDVGGNPETKAADLASQTRTQGSNLELSAKALSDRGLEVLVAMTTPLPAELQSFREARAEQDSERTILKNNITKLEDDMSIVAGSLEGLMQCGEVPTVEHLTDQRQQRDGMWQKIRRKAYPDGKAISDPMPTAAEYEMAVLTADGTADSRFADVERVSQHADFVKRMAQMRLGLELERERLAEANRKTEALKQQWQALLAKHGLPCLGVTELTEWIARRDGLVERYQAYVGIKVQASMAAEGATTVRSDLSRALVEADLPPCADAESLVQVIARAREHAGEAGEAAAKGKLLARQKAQAETKLTDSERKIIECKNDLAEWRTQWAQSMTAIRLDAAALGIEATARLAQFEELDAALNTLDEARTALHAARITEARTESETKRLCKAIGYEPGERPVDAVIETVYERLRDSRAQDQLAKNLADKIDTVERTKTQARQSMTLANEDLAALVAAAGCQTLVELAEAEDRSAERIRLDGELAAVEERLVEASALPLQELLAQAAEQDIVQVRVALDRAGEDLKAANPQVETVHKKLIDAQAALDKVDGMAKASAAEQKAADVSARLSTLIAEYAATTVASAVLSNVIEIYQQRHQGPLLARASELFATITGGKFVKVATDFDEDKTVLVGVRNNGKREGVEALSSGRRDQLFLALRLAAIESHVTNQGPIPVVVDDIVINFDDAAASATFKVLADLSTKTQVLFFTHHEHLLGRATAILGAEKFIAHSL
jgi:uncharacterized protein YhaN